MSVNVPPWLLDPATWSLLLSGFAGTMVGVFTAFQLEGLRQSRGRKRERAARDEHRRRLAKALMFEVNANLDEAKKVDAAVKPGVSFIPVRMRTGLWVVNREQYAQLCEDVEELADFSRFFEAADHLDRLLRFLESAPPRLHGGIISDPPVAIPARKQVSEPDVIAEIAQVVKEIRTYGSALGEAHHEFARPIVRGERSGPVLAP